jgi:DNA mismatch repair protein MutS2
LAAAAPRAARTQQAATRAAQAASRLREQARDELRQTQVAHLGASPAERERAAPVLGFSISPRKAAVGDSVKLRSLGKSGVVRNKSDNWLEVEVGHLRTRVPYDEISEVIPAVARPAASKPAPVRVQMERVAQGSLSEINVIGENADDARSRVDKFLDNAYLASLSRVRVIHGSGKGILRKALAEMFAEHPHVEKFSPAPQEEGGAGATIVELKV